MQKSLLAIVATAAITSASPGRANCVELIGWPAGLAFPTPCPVTDSGLEKAFASQDAKSLMSIAASTQQLLETAQQMTNDINLLTSMFKQYQGLSVSFTPFTAWNQIPTTRGMTSLGMINNFRTLYTAWNINTSLAMRSASVAGSYSFAAQSASMAQSYAVQQQKYDAENNTGDLVKLANAVTTSQSYSEDWDANTAIRIKILQQQQIRNTMLARLATSRAAGYAVHLMPKITTDDVNEFQTSSSTFQLPTPASYGDSPQ